MFAAKIFQIGTGVISAVYNGVVYTVDKSHHYYNELFNSFRDDDVEKFKEYYSKKYDLNTIVKQKLSNPDFNLTESGLTYKGRELDGVIVNRILEMKKAGINFDFMINFLENLFQNPSNRSIKELYEFLEKENIPITPDGCFLAYKSVRNDMLSKHSGNLKLIQGADVDGRIDNSVGQVIECLRSDVDDERDNTCSHGLHVGGLRYSGPGGTYSNTSDITVIVKVNPKDVVSVPRDHNAEKIRVCKYEVVSVYESPLDNISSVQDIRLEPEDLIDKKISFNYNGKTRYAFVEDILDNTRALVILLQNDNSYNEDDYYRTFKFHKMSDIKVI